MHKRDAVKISGLAFLTGIVTPTKWSKPLLNSVILPTHAQTSICVGFLGQDFVFDAAGSSRGNHVVSSENIIQILNFGALNGDLIVDFTVGGGSLSVSLNWLAISGAGDAFLDYTYSCSGVTTGPFRLTIQNLVA